jgi:hypothetical protein
MRIEGDSSMQQFRLGPAAVQTIQKINNDLNRFNRNERLSIVRFLGLSAAPPTGTTAAMTRKVPVKGKVKKAA